MTGCSNKVAYTTKAEARTARDRFHRAYGLSGRKQVYWCPWCGKWHLGRPRRKMRKW